MLSTALSPAPDPAVALSEQLRHATAVRWRAILDYRDAMAARGDTVVFAPYGGTIDRFIRRVGTPVGEDLVVLGRDGEAGRLWDAVPGAGVAAAYGDTVLHGSGSDVDAWQVCGRYRRIATAAHPDNPAEPVHVLHRLEELTH